MKSKKLSSLLCAAAMTVSAFAGMTITASAAEEPVWSWDGSTVLSGFGNAEVGIDSEGKFLQISGTGSHTTQTFSLPAAAQLSDDYVIDFDTYIHAANGQGRANGYTQVLFMGDTETKDTGDYGGAYGKAINEKLGPFNMADGGIGTGNYDTAEGSDKNEGIGYISAPVGITARNELQGKWILNYANATPTLDDGDVQTTVGEWARVRAAVKDNKATFTVLKKGDTEGTTVVKNAPAGAMKKIKLVLGRGDMNFFTDVLPATGVAVVQLDNIKVYDGVDNAPALNDEGLRTVASAITWGNPEEVAGKAPQLTAPQSATNVKTINFDSDSTDTKLAVVKGGAEASLSGGLSKISVGGRDDGDPNSTASIVNLTSTNKAVKLSAGQYAPGGRSPMLHVADSAVAADATTVLGFSVYMSKNMTSGNPKLWLIDADKADALKNTSASAAAYYSGVFGLLQTTAPNDSTKFSSNFQRGIQLSSDEWHTVVVAIDADGKYRIFIDGDYQDPEKSDGVLAKVVAETLHYGGTAYAPKNLPVLAVENVGTNTKSNYATVLIDNVITYQVDGTTLDNLPLTAPVVMHKVGIKPSADGTSVDITAACEHEDPDPAEEDAFDGILIHAKYTDVNGVKTLDKVKVYDAAGINADGAIKVDMADDDTVAIGDKLMVWDGFKSMIPYGAIVAATGAEPTPTPTPKPTPTQSVPSDYTITVESSTNGKVEADKTTAKEGDTVTLTVTPDDGYVLGTLTVTDASNKAVTVDSNNTFKMPASNVTVKATFTQLPELTGTVEIAGTAKVGETITATTDGLPSGATAKYQWQSADAASGTYTDIQGATESTYKLTSGLVDKYVKVVVTADDYRGDVQSNVLGPVEEPDTPITKYSITSKVEPEGTATVAIKDTGVDITEAAEGDIVSVEATAVGDNEVSEIVVTAADEEENIFNAEGNTFTMPAKAVTVTVKTVKLYTITKTTPVNGTFNVSAEKAKAGAEISITDISAEGGYVVDTVSVTDAGSSPVQVSEDNKFTMPASNVTVTVTFRELVPEPTFASLEYRYAAKKPNSEGEETYNIPLFVRVETTGN